MKLSIQTLLAVVVMIGLLCGWLLTWQRVDGHRKESEKKLRVAQEELLRARDRHFDQAIGLET